MIGAPQAVDLSRFPWHRPIVTACLRQFPTVDWVKIYGPDGSTEQSQGQVDSIPTCLEP